MSLIGEGEYNLDSTKEIQATDSFLGMDVDIIECQNTEPLNNCSTRKYIDSLLGQCGCLPLNIRLSNEV